MRTSFWDCVRLCISLIRAKDERRYLRIQQIIENAVRDEHAEADPYYFENADIAKCVSRFTKVNGYRVALVGGPWPRPWQRGNELGTRR